MFSCFNQSYLINFVELKVRASRCHLFLHIQHKSILILIVTHTVLHSIWEAIHKKTKKGYLIQQILFLYIFKSHSVQILAIALLQLTKQHHHCKKGSRHRMAVKESCTVKLCCNNHGFRQITISKALCYYLLIGLATVQFEHHWIWYSPEVRSNAYKLWFCYHLLTYPNAVLNELGKQKIDSSPSISTAFI